MYPKKLNRTLHVSKRTSKEESIKSLIIDKLIADYGKKQQLNTNLIVAYVEDFFVSYKATEGAVRALKEEIQEAVLRTDEEKQLLIQKLNQRALRKLKEQQLKTIINPKQQIEESISNKLQNQSLNASQLKLANTMPTDEQPRRSIYQVDGSVDEWAAIIKYDTVQFQRELEHQKRLLLVNKQKMKEELDRQVAEKEQRKFKEKQEDQLYFTTSQQQLVEFEKIQEQLKEAKKQQIMQEKIIRDQQVTVDKKKKKEQNLSCKLQEEEMLAKVKEEIKAEDEQQKKKRLEQKEKFQQILKLNENLRKKAKEEVIQSKEYEKLLTEQYIIKEQLENDRREKVKQEREDKVKKFMNHYSDFVSKKKKEEGSLEGSISDTWAKKNSEHNTFMDLRNKSNKKELQLQFSYDLQQQILEKKRRYTQEVADKRNQFEQQIQEQKQLKQQEDERRKNIRQMHIMNAEELKKQMVKGYLSSSPKRKLSPSEKMIEKELLQNKKILKKIANDTSLGIQIKKSEIAIPE